MKISFKLDYKYVLIITFCFVGVLGVFLKLEMIGNKNTQDVKVVNIDVQSEEVATGYIVSKGYKIVSFEGIIDKSLKLPIKLEKNIKTYKYIVTNHPLQKIYKGGKNEIEVYIVVDNEKVIMAYSSPILDNPKVLKQFYTIDGKPLIEDPKIVYPDDATTNE